MGRPERRSGRALTRRNLTGEWRCFAEIKQDPEWKTIPVLMLTTSRDEADIVESYRRHTNAYLVKPFDMEDHQRMVRSIDAFWLATAVLPN